MMFGAMWPIDHCKDLFEKKFLHDNVNFYLKKEGGDGVYDFIIFVATIEFLEDFICNEESSLYFRSCIFAEKFSVNFVESIIRKICYECNQKKCEKKIYDCLIHNFELEVEEWHY
jgi:hypothetical protein